MGTSACTGGWSIGDTHPSTEGARNGRSRHGRADRWRRPGAACPRGGPAERFAARRGGTPRRCSSPRCSRGFAVLAGVSILLGLLVTDVLVRVDRASGAPTASAIESIVADRTPFLTDVSAVGSAVGGAPVLPILVGLIALVCAALRRGGSPPSPCSCSSSSRRPTA